MKLRHVVLFGFKKTVSEAEAAHVAERFGALRGEVPGIEAFEWGVNCSPEGLHHGLTHCFVLTFATALARDAYLIHPRHVAFSKSVRPLLDAATVVDYWTEAAAS